MTGRGGGWAKAPDYAHDPASATRLRAATAEDRREFLENGLVLLACADCATRVLVKKNSPQHTSVQWQSDPAASCPEFAAQVAAGTVSARIDGCSRLHASIDEAVRAGVVPVPDEGGEPHD